MLSVNWRGYAYIITKFKLKRSTKDIIYFHGIFIIIRLRSVM